MTVGGSAAVPDPGGREGLRAVPDPCPRDVGPRLDAARRQRGGPRGRRSSTPGRHRSDPPDAGHGALPRAAADALADEPARSRPLAGDAAASDRGASTARSTRCASRSTRAPLRALLRDTLSPNVIHAGVKYNVIPGDATIEVDCRFLPGHDRGRHRRRGRAAHRPRAARRVPHRASVVGRAGRGTGRRPAVGHAGRRRSATTTRRASRSRSWPRSRPTPRHTALVGTSRRTASRRSASSPRSLPRALPRRRRTRLARRAAVRAAGPLRRGPPLLRLTIARGARRRRRAARSSRRTATCDRRPPSRSGSCRRVVLRSTSRSSHRRRDAGPETSRVRSRARHLRLALVVPGSRTRSTGPSPRDSCTRRCADCPPASAVLRRIAMRRLDPTAAAASSRCDASDWSAMASVGDLLRRRPPVAAPHVPGSRVARISRPRRLMAWVASAATPIATIARSGGRQRPDRGQELLGPAAVDDPQDRVPTRREAQDLLAPVLLLGATLDEAPLDEPVDEAARRRRRAVDRFGELADGQRAAVGEHVQRRELGEPEPQLAELAGEADDELPPQRAAHRHALADLADVRQSRARGQDGRREVGLEARAIARRGRRPGRGRRGAVVGHACKHAREFGRLAASARPRTLRRRCPRSPSSFPARARKRGHGPGLAASSAGRGRHLRGGRRRPRRADQHARLGRTGRAARSTENAQPALLAASIAILEALRERWARRRARRAGAGLRRRPLDGPVLGPRRRRRAVARGRRPPRPASEAS